MNAFVIAVANYVAALLDEARAASAQLLASLGFTDLGQVETAHGARRQFSLGAPPPE
jgi:pyruvate dehydrogenase complex dehydrogenase (E1) component